MEQVKIKASVFGFEQGGVYKGKPVKAGYIVFNGGFSCFIHADYIEVV